MVTEVRLVNLKHLLIISTLSGSSISLIEGHFVKEEYISLRFAENSIVFSLGHSSKQEFIFSSFSGNTTFSRNGHIWNELLKFVILSPSTIDVIGSKPELITFVTGRPSISSGITISFPASRVKCPISTCLASNSVSGIMTYSNPS